MAYTSNEIVHCGRAIAAFSWLGALRNFDLQIVGVDHVIGRNAEAGRGHLLDRAAAQIAIRVGKVAGLILSALAVLDFPPMRFIAIASVSCASY